MLVGGGLHQSGKNDFRHNRVWWGGLSVIASPGEHCHQTVLRYEIDDLHGCTVPEAMRQFIVFYNDCVRSGYQGFIEVIHGYGSSGPGGAIQRELRRYLGMNSDRLEMYIAGESVGNPGIAKVHPKKLLPAIPDSIGFLTNKVREAILGFCGTPKIGERLFSRLSGRFGERLLRDDSKTGSGGTAE
jgi:hypothetical protein